jgi:two-component system response regulator YesN
MLVEIDASGASYERAVLLDAAGRVDAVRIHLRYGLDSLLLVVKTQRVLDEKTVLDVQRRMHHALARAASSTSMVLAFRDGLKVLIQAVKSPSPVRLELKLAEAARYVEEHCAEPLTLARVARHVGLSVSYFSTQFKSTLGAGFIEYLCKVRVEKAKHLLRYSSHNISHVGSEAGFVSFPHFSRTFKRIVGETPSRYRTRISGR